MISWTVLLLLMNLAKGSESSPEISKRMSYLLTKLCPESDICGVNVTTRKENPASTLSPCCSDCSCSHDCAEYGDCCFPSYNQTLHNKTESYSIEAAYVDRQCFYPVTDARVTDFSNFHSYYMISSLKWKDTFNQTESCGSVKLRPWGSFHPVFSKQKNTIYMNELCSEIDNVTDGVFWDAILVCVKINPEDLQAHMEHGVLPKQCRVHFMYPGDYSDIKSQMCYRDMVESCTEFEVPLKYVNATKNEIREACQSGLVSPYYGSQIIFYANVFCHICSGSYFNVNQGCPKFQYEHIIEKSDVLLGGKGFIGLFDFNLFTTTSEKSTDVLNNIKGFTSTACRVTSERETFDCRPVLCPSGQVRNDKGTCVFPIKVWNRQSINVLLELNSERDIDMTKAFLWREGFLFVDNIESLSMSSSLNLNEWEVIKGFYKPYPNDENQTNFLLLYMERSFLLTSPMNVSQNVRLLMKTNWLLKYGNDTLVLKPSLFEMKFPYPVPFPNDSINGSFNLQWPVYKQFALIKEPLRGIILITQLHFCEQIELRLGEYQLHSNNSVMMYMYNKIARQYLFDGEFVVMPGVEEGLVRICLEESGFVKQYDASCADINSVRAALVMSVVFLAKFQIIDMLSMDILKN